VKLVLVVVIVPVGPESMSVSGATVSIFTATGIAVEPAAAPTLPGVSVAVQLIECVPSPVILNVRFPVVAVSASNKPSVMPLNVSVHVIAVTSDGSVPSTVPVTVVLYHPAPFADESNVNVTTGGSESTVNVRLSGVASTLPAVSFARTLKVCEPSARLLSG